MIIHVSLDVSEENIQRLTLAAYRYGWLREKPEAPWNNKERKEAVRFAISKLLEERKL